MTPYIFPGLSQPKSQLFFDIQTMIAHNGGRLRLAKYLEIEQFQTFHQREKYFASHKINSYTDADIAFILENFEKLSGCEIAFELNRPVKGLYQKISRMQKASIIGYKRSLYTRR